MDLSILATVNKPEADAPEEYVAPVDYNEPAPVGDYTIRVIDGKFKDRESAGVEDPYRLSKTRNGDLSVEVALEALEPLKGKRFYDRLNLAPFKNGGNTFFNALMGLVGPQLKTANQALTEPADYLKALDKAIGKGATAKVYVNKEWYCNPNAKDYQGCGTSTKASAANQEEIRITCPGPHPTGLSPTLLARNTISKYRSLV